MKKIIATAFLLISLTGSALAGSGSMGCFEVPTNDTALDHMSGFDKQAEREKGYAENENPAQELFFCAMSVATQPLAKENCRCKERVRELCGFGFRKGNIFYKVKNGAQLPWCLAFPLSMWTRL
jgi:hypothetical protein